MLCISESALCVASVCVFLNKPVCVPLAKPRTCFKCWCHVPRSVGGVETLCVCHVGKLD